jgi:hypothetical protein
MAARGYLIFPCVPNGKEPLLIGSWRIHATRDVKKIRAWFKKYPGMNYGIALGDEQIVVDVDNRKGGDKSYAQHADRWSESTLRVRTWSGSQHDYQCKPADLKIKNGNDVLPGIGAKTSGGYVVGPGSIINGSAYEIIEDAPAAACPRWFLEQCGKARPKADNAGKRIAEETDATIERAAMWLQKYAPEAIEGQSGDRTTYEVAAQLGDFGVTADTALALMLEHWNPTKAIPPWEPDELAQKVASGFKNRQNPIGVDSPDYCPFPKLEIDESKAPSIAPSARPAKSKTATKSPPSPQTSDDGVALRFAEQYGDSLRYCAALGKWLVWDGKRWLFDETLLARKYARDICRDLAIACNEPNVGKQIASAKTVGAVERLAQADRRIAATHEQFDADLFLLNTPAGTVDLRTGKIHEHRVDDYQTKITGVAPDSSCPTPHWRKFLARVTGDNQELVDYLQRVAGYSLTGSTKEHVLFFLFGRGANGKTTFLNVLTGAVGDYHRAAPVETFTASQVDRHPTELAGLRGARGLGSCARTFSRMSRSSSF